ncbi:MAG: hypothetical protein LBL13_11415, partial [Bacteroidales bacterium]|nr:hypothetical protein [Bacteroidales bacterium]
MRKNYRKFLGFLALCAIVLVSVSNIALGQALPTVNMSNQTICLGDSAMITVTGTPPFDIQFSTTLNGVSTGQFNRHIEASQINNNGEVFLASEDTGTYIFTLVSITDINGTNSSLSLSATVRVNALPTVKMTDLINSKDTICLGDSKELSLTGESPYTLKYKDNVWGENTMNIPGNTTTIASTLAGKFVFDLLELTDNNGCQVDLLNTTDNTVQAEILVNVLTVQMTGLKNGKDTICLGESKELVFKGIAPYNIEFRANGITYQKTDILTDTLLVPSEKTGSFGFKLVSLTDASGCTYDAANSTDTADIFVRGLPTLQMTDLIDDKDTICLGEEKALLFTGIAPFDVEFTSSKNNGAPGTFYKKGISSNNELVPSLEAGDFKFMLVSLTDGNGCQADISN